MNYQTLDWTLEARRIGKAFGVSGAVWFEDNDWYRFLQSEAGRSAQHGRGLVPLESGLMVECHYSCVTQYFAIVEIAEKELIYSGISLDWDGNLRQSSAQQPHAFELAQGLFHLGSLSEAVEAALGVDVSAHEKIEWAIRQNESG